MAAMRAPRTATTPERRITIEEFEGMPEFEERYELIDGKLVEKPMPKFEHTDIGWFILKTYDRFDPDEKIGTMRHETSVRIHDDAPVPDLSFWLAARRPTRKTPISPRPDLAVEIQSQDQSLKSLFDKAADYISAGVQIVWVIQPNKKLVHIFRPGQEVPEIVRKTGELSGESLIPGFKLSLKALFEE